MVPLLKPVLLLHHILSIETIGAKRAMSQQLQPASCFTCNHSKWWPWLSPSSPLVSVLPLQNTAVRRMELGLSLAGAPPAGGLPAFRPPPLHFTLLLALPGLSLADLAAPSCCSPL